MSPGRISPGARVYLGASAGIIIGLAGFGAWLVVPAPGGGEAAPVVATAQAVPPAVTAAHPPPPETVPPATTTTSTTTTTITTTTTAGPPPPPSEPERGYLVIHGVGDVALDPAYIPTFRTEGYEFAWSGLGGMFANDDLTVINLECSPSPLGSPIPKAFNFRCDPDALRPSRAARQRI